jgi:hypothetical protein
MSGWLGRLRTAGNYGHLAFPACACHAQAANAVHRAVEQLTGTRHPTLSLDETVAEALGHAGTGLYPGLDSLATVEVALAVEEEYGLSSADALDDATAHRILAILLGPAAKASSWDARTVWVRSIRAIINARVGRDAACLCSKHEAAQQRVEADEA